MGFTKIKTEDVTGKGVTGLPDVPGLDTTSMQRKFDELSKDIIIPKHNALVDELESETAAGSVGMVVPEGMVAEPNIQAIVDKVYENNKENTESRHTHTNKSVLDSITEFVKQGYDRLASLLLNISEISDMVKNSSASLPTGKAIVDYVADLGGGDMAKAVYDTNGNGIVDNSEKLGGQLPQYYQQATDVNLPTDNKTIPGAIKEVYLMAQNGGKNLVGDEFNPEKDYLAGDYAIYGNVLFRFTADKAAGEWDETKVEQVTVAQVLCEQNHNLDNIKTYVGSDGKIHFTNSAGADTVLPFNNLKNLSWGVLRATSTFETSSSNPSGTLTSGTMEKSGFIIAISFIYPSSSGATISISGGGSILDNFNGHTRIKCSRFEQGETYTVTCSQVDSSHSTMYIVIKAV